MINNELLNTISDSTATNNISTAMTRKKESRKFKILESYNSKYDFGKNNFIKGLKYREDKVISIDNYKALLRERVINDEKELLWLLRNTEVKNIKLAKDLDLSRFNIKDRIIDINGLTINGNGNCIILSERNDILSQSLLTLKGKGILLKNITIKVNCDNKNKKRAIDVISILGDNTKLINIKIQTKGNNGIKISQCFAVELNKIYIKGSESKSSAIKVESAGVVCKNIKIKSFKTGLESVGRAASLTIFGKQSIDTQFHIKNNFKSGSIIKAVENKLNLLETVFCYEYFKLPLN
ncbi:hypothetical protein [Sarcina ventriculi]|uniref:hypothetical protein n=1 Tax=Sarcina ventriculi TaxID=1267 RepID=UPI00073F3DE7|nr:hypothetical protein [Sarcina ventriculi]